MCLLLRFQKFGGRPSLDQQNHLLGLFQTSQIRGHCKLHATSAMLGSNRVVRCPSTINLWRNIDRLGQRTYLTYLTVSWIYCYCWILLFYFRHGCAHWSVQIDSWAEKLAERLFEANLFSKRLPGVCKSSRRSPHAWCSPGTSEQRVMEAARLLGLGRPKK